MKRINGLNLEVSAPATAARLISARWQRDVEGTGRKGEDPATSASRQHTAALAASQGHAASLIPAAASYYGLSLEDYETKQNAICYLNREVDAWRSKQHPRGPFRADITDGAFAHISASSQRFFQYNWDRFVKGRKWYKFYFAGAGAGVVLGYPRPLGDGPANMSGIFL